MKMTPLQWDRENREAILRWANCAVEDMGIIQDRARGLLDAGLSQAIIVNARAVVNLVTASLILLVQESSHAAQG